MITTLKELGFTTDDFTDFSKVDLTKISPLLVPYLPEDQKNQLFIKKQK